MASYLIATWEGGGSVAPVLSVARGLARRGHDVRVIADPVVGGEVEAAGVEFVPWKRGPHRTERGPEGDLFRDWEARTPFGAFARIRDRLMFGPAAAAAEDVLEELRRRPADAIATEAALGGPLVAAEAAGVPVAVLMTTIYARRAPGLPAFGSGFMPARGPLGRARDALLGAFGERIWQTGLEPLNAARAAHGLGAVESVFDPWDRAACVLMLTSAAFDFRAEALPPNVRYVGPRLEDPEWVGGWSPPAGDAPLVLVGLSSTYQEQEPVLRRVASALGRLPVRGLITLGPAAGLERLDAPANVTVVGSAPHAEVLRHAAAVVTHAGHGTAIKALASGVPVLTLPMGRDQLDVAARVVASGAGERLKPSASSRAIARSVDRLLRDPGYRRNAERMAEAIAADVAEDRAAEELEAVASQPAARASGAVA